MTAFLLADHLLNFMLPAAAVALLLMALGRPLAGFLGGKGKSGRGWWRQAATLFAVNLAVLVAGLAVFGHDGKMLTYAALVLGAAGCRWWQLRGWAT